MQNENFFSIAELDIKICFAESPFNGMHLIPSLEPFREKNLKGELFFQLSVDDTLRAHPINQGESFYFSRKFYTFAS